jgi:hypothetical protein
MSLGPRLVVPLLLVASLIAYLVVSRDGGERRAYAACMTTTQCLKGEVCAVVPKDDGFATMGTCTAPCTAGGAECLNGWACAPFVEVDGFAVPASASAAKGQKAAARALCAPPVR